MEALVAIVGLSLICLGLVWQIGRLTAQFAEEREQLHNRIAEPQAAALHSMAKDDSEQGWVKAPVRGLEYQEESFAEQQRKIDAELAKRGIEAL